MNIADLKEGERGIVEDIVHEDIPLKLVEMGCLPGNEVLMMQRAPFKDPICIKINGSVIALRKNIAKRIMISKI
ncbi:MAG: ferrous iron transport protein A [Chitinophagales bacterium]|nr:ferrous iron transport protein A [Chitinophagales bacterium]